MKALHRYHLLTALFLIAAALMCAHPAHAAGKTKKVTADQTFLQLPAISASIGGPYHFSGLMVVEFGLEIPDEKLRARAESLAPRLRDAHSQAMMQFALAYYKPGTVPNADEIANRLQKATDTVLGTKGAKVLLGSILLNNT